MALAFNSKPVATIKAKKAGSTSDYLSMHGCTTADSLTPDVAAAQLNKLFNIGGLSVVADTSMTRVFTEEVFDNE